MSKLNILIPIETINREIDNRLFLAAYLSDLGYKIYVGQHDFLDKIAQKLNGGIYIGKEIFKTTFNSSVDLTYLNNLKANNFKIIYLDEEGAFFLGGEDSWKYYLDTRIIPGLLDQQDSICTWGKFQANHYKDHGANIVTTGHPRFELYKPRFSSFFEKEVQEIKHEYGDFVLINTNLSYANNSFGLEDTFSGRLGYDKENTEKRLDMVRKWNHISKILSNIVLLIHELSAKFPERTFIVRPHPGEDEEFYKTVFNGIQNIKVIHSGPVTPWILASEILIHDGCTTAVEAYLNDKEVILYKSFSNDSYDQFVPNSIGVKCETIADVISCLQQIHKGKSTYSLPDKAKDLLYNFENNDVFEILVELVNKTAIGIRVEKNISDVALIKLVSKEKISESSKKVVRPFFTKKQSHYLAAKKKFYGFDKLSINSKMELIIKIAKKDIKYKVLSPNLIVFE